MAAYIPVPRDLTRVKTKVFFNLTKRQLLCFGAAALIGVPIFFLVKATGNVSLAALSMMIVMLPLFFLAMYEKDSQPLEVVVSQWSWHPGCRRAQSGWQMTAIGHALLSFPMRRSISLWLRTAMGTELSLRARCTAVIISP